MINSRQSFTKRPLPALAAAIAACFLFSGAVSTLTAGTITSADTFQITVSTDMVDMVKAQRGTFGKEAMDTMPLLEFRDIQFLHYDRTWGVETTFEFVPGVYERLKPRLARLAMHSFVIYQNRKPVYSGVLVPNEAAFEYLKTFRYCGLVIILPPKNFDSGAPIRMKISFVPHDGIYLRKEDPRGDIPMIWLFKKTGKILL